MNKRYIKALNCYINDINKSIFDLDIGYLKNIGYSLVEEIKAEEKTEILNNHFYVFDKCYEMYNYIGQRFKISYEIKNKRGNLVEIIITDNKTNLLYSNYFNWHPIITKEHIIPSLEILSWLNNTLISVK